MPKRIGKLTRGLGAIVWLYVAVLAVVWLLLRFGGDRWWFATLILFGPRWLCAVPLAALVPAAALVRRRLLWPLTAAAVVAIGPIMGFCLPWARLAPPSSPTLRVLTCNLKGRCRDNTALDDLIRSARPDIVALQGCWGDVRVAWPETWHVCRQGELLIASRYRLDKVQRLSQGSSAEDEGELPPDPRLHLLGCVVAAPQGDICFCTMHPVSPHSSIARLLSRDTVLRPSASPYLEAEIADRWQDAADLRQRLDAWGGAQIVAGDLNLPSDSPIFSAYWAAYWDAFGSVGLGFGYTEWPRLPRLPRLRFGIRIDHILSSPGWRPSRCWVGPDVGSDHRPLIADLGPSGNAK